MHLVQDVLHGYLDVFVVVFIDNILVYSKNTKEHAEHLRLIFERLRKHQLFATASKCTLHINKVEFLGQWITPEGAAPIAEKLRAVCDWEPPNSVKDVRSFLGFANYYHRFVPGCAGIASPLTLLTKKIIEWHWGPVRDVPLAKNPSTGTAQQRLFLVLKVVLHAIVVISEVLRLSTKSRCSRCCRAHLYSEGCPGGIMVITDHQPSTHLVEQQVLSQTQARYV